MLSEILFDYHPGDSTLATAIAADICPDDAHTVLPHRDIVGQLNPLQSMSLHAQSAALIILIWSSALDRLARIEPDIARQCNARLRNSGLGKILILHPSDIEVPLFLRDLPRFSIAEVSKHLIEQILRFQRPAVGAVAAMTGKIFISYSRRDQRCARNVRSAILDLGHDPWMDNADISPENMFGGQIVRAIRDAKSFLLLLTRHSLQSPHCLRETYSALEFGKSMHVYVHGDVELTDDWKYPLSGVHRQAIDCDSLSANGWGMELTKVRL